MAVLNRQGKIWTLHRSSGQSSEVPAYLLTKFAYQEFYG
jgi:hypothetical protein